MSGFIEKSEDGQQKSQKYLGHTKNSFESVPHYKDKEHSEICVAVQFYPWFKFYFLLFQTHYHTLPYPKTKENKIQTKDKIEPQHV